MPSLSLIFQAKNPERALFLIALWAYLLFFSAFCPFGFPFLLPSFLPLPVPLFISLSHFPSELSTSIYPLDDASVITLTPSHFLQSSFPSSMTSVKLPRNRTDNDN